MYRRARRWSRSDSVSNSRANLSSVVGSSKLGSASTHRRIAAFLCRHPLPSDLASRGKRMRCFSWNVIDARLRHTGSSGSPTVPETQCERRLSKISWKACDQVSWATAFIASHSVRLRKTELRTCFIRACENGAVGCNMRRSVARCLQSPGVPSMELDCIIVGGGPAGLTAATYLRRLHRQVNRIRRWP
jgi:hypothetical protein